MREMKRPLEGIKVVELSTFIAGPCCARYLADLGAEVIKIESPKGDPLRYTAVNEGRPFGDAEDVSFTLENTGKKCISLNTKTEKGREILEDIISSSDILITNWRQPALKRSELDYETLKVKYPKLVFGYVSGYGEKGPDKDLPGFDFTAFFARGGVMGTMYDKTSQPMMPVAGFGDHQVGMYLASGILAALYRARETGFGDKVTVSLFHTAIWDISLFLQSSQYGDPSTQYPISKKQVANPLNMAFKTKDNQWIQISMPNYAYYYPKFMEAINHKEMIEDKRYFPQENLQNNLEEFYNFLVSTIQCYLLDEFTKIMTEADLPYAICQTWNQLLKDQQAWEADALTEVTYPNGSKRTMVRTPVLFAETELPAYERASFLGENTGDVLAGLGYNKDQIKAMIEAGEATACTRIG